MRALSRKNANRKSLLRNLTTSLILYERVTTTSPKAKELQPIVEKIITKAKEDNLTSRRALLGYLFDKNATKKVFEVLVPRYKKVKSGFVKTYKIGPRPGDAAPMTIIEFIKIQEETSPSTKLGVKEKDAKNEKPETGEKPAGKTKNRKTNAKAK